ncbi:uncharacterized protein LOC115531543 isoform X2 [Gadus morhua]|uniref:uncharacterized protein LOC115531543 isoform X2 n=1 Tax=Gadus morhua TaxID=8049 RepID=UPI0011B491A0|nr:uncharacterized protein LOC115531543 isoform X2 [Gadus morhua]
MDLTFLLAAVIFTLLAIVVATSIFNGSPSSVDFARSYFGPKDKAQAGLDKSSAWQNGHITNKKKTADDWNEVSGSSHDHWEVVKSVLSTEGISESPDVDELKYLPGRAQASRIETMMSKQELEEEQRVQREQLAAIFQLLRENKQTFGEVSEGELEDQFRLYST